MSSGKRIGYCQLGSNCVKTNSRFAGRSLFKSTVLNCEACGAAMCSTDCLACHQGALPPKKSNNSMKRKLCSSVKTVVGKTISDVQDDVKKATLDLSVHSAPQPTPRQEVTVQEEPSQSDSSSSKSNLSKQPLTTEEVVMLAIQKERIDPRPGVWVVELYSGCGLHGKTVKRALERLLVLASITKAGSFYRPVIRLTSIDVDPGTAPTLLLDALGLNDVSIEMLRRLSPQMKVVLLASPPCQSYSIANTTGTVDLVAADNLVGVVQRLHTGLNSIFTVMENPATGLLPGRKEVTAFLTHNVVVHYCAHGGMFYKPTMLWSNVALSECGFTPRLCLGKPGDDKPGCPLYHRNELTGRWIHPQWESTKLEERMSIPTPLSYEIGAAVAKHLMT